MTVFFIGCGPVVPWDPDNSYWYIEGTQDGDEAAYAMGYDKPRYPVPAIPTQVGYQPSGINECAGIAYIYVSTETYLQTFWQGLGLFEERC